MGMVMSHCQSLTGIGSTAPRWMTEHTRHGYDMLTTPRYTPHQHDSSNSAMGLPLELGLRTVDRVATRFALEVPFSSLRVEPIVLSCACALRSLHRGRRRLVPVIVGSDETSTASEESACASCTLKQHQHQLCFINPSHRPHSRLQP